MTTTAKTTLKALSRKVRIVNQYGARLDYDLQDKWQRESTGWTCTLRYQGRQYTFDFWQGMAHTSEPTAHGTLECLLSDAQAGEQSFEDFCAELGYDNDSRKAEQIHRQCQKTTIALKRLLGSDYETFLYADRD